MLVYSRTVSKEAYSTEAGLKQAVDNTEQHVRAHLSSVADADDDPTTNADDVNVEVYDRGDHIYVCGQLDAEPNAPYLREGYDPEKEAAEGR